LTVEVVVSNESAPGGAGTESYGEVVQRLESVVKRLEGGELSLEDSLREFEEGIRLVRKGERLLTDAEKRIEQLLTEGGGEDRIVPLQSTGQAAGAAVTRSKAPPPSRPAASPSQAAPANGEDDVPF
jgi:exodeoxyribonuclease VII small subunit